jgi:hypothetical protein
MDRLSQTAIESDRLRETAALGPLARCWLLCGDGCCAVMAGGIGWYGYGRYRSTKAGRGRYSPCPQMPKPL